MEKIKVIKDACIGCGACQAIASDVFEINEDGISEVKSDVIYDNLTKEQIDDVMDAIEGCPTEAIVKENE